MFGPGTLFWMSLITDSMYLIFISLFMLSISSSMSFGSLYISMNQSTSSKLPNLWASSFHGIPLLYIFHKIKQIFSIKQFHVVCTNNLSKLIIYLIVKNERQILKAHIVYNMSIR